MKRAGYEMRKNNTLTTMRCGGCGNTIGSQEEHGYSDGMLVCEECIEVFEEQEENEEDF